MRAAIYARVSSDRQARDGTIASQLRDLPAYCDRQAWAVTDVYVDDGKSAAAGKLDARDGLRRLLEDAAAGRFDVVVVADLDRLTRSEDLTERGAILGALQRAGVRVATAAGQLLDLDSTAGDLLAALGGAFAAEWLRKHRARVAAGKLTAIGRGRKPAGPTPYGYHYDRATGAWSADPDTAPIVRELYARVAAGETCRILAEDLDARGVPRPRGGSWHREAVWALVRRRVYSTGRWVADRARGLEVTVPTLVEPEAYDAAQRALERHRKRGLCRTKHVYLLEGLAHCERCGGDLGIASSVRQRRAGGREVTVPARYVCTHRRRPRGGERCSAPYHETAEVDAALWAALADVVTSPEVVERAMRRRRDGGGAAPDTAAELARARAELERLDRAERTLLERVASITPAYLDAQLARIATARAEASGRVDAAARATSAGRVALAATAGLAERIAQLRVALADPAVVSDGRRRELVRALVADVAVGDRGLVARVHLPAASIGLASGPGSSTTTPDHRVDLGRLRVTWASARAAA